VRAGRHVQRSGISGAEDKVGEVIAVESDKEEFTPLGIVGFLQIEGDGNMAFDGGDIGGGSGVRVLGGRGVDGLAHLVGAVVEFVL
jgi:hypothetical protein